MYYQKLSNCSCIYLFNEPFNAQTIADLWKDVSFILMCGVLFIGLVSFPSLFKAWFKSILSALSLGFLGVSIIVIVSTYSTQDSFILLVSTVLVFAILYIPKTYKIVRALWLLVLWRRQTPVKKEINGVLFLLLQGLESFLRLSIVWGSFYSLGNTSSAFHSQIS